MNELRLLESLRWTAQEGYFLLDAHLARLEQAARWWAAGFIQPPQAAAKAGEQAAGALRSHALAALQAIEPAGPAPAYKVRLLAGWDGQGWQFSTQAEPLPELTPAALQARPPADGTALLRLGLARQPVAADDPFLRHKTTRRTLYQAARAAHPDCDEVLLWNEAGDLTEACASNLVVRLDGKLLTPPLACGLLPGVFRGWLLECGTLQEAPLQVEQLGACQQLWLINSVRGWRQGYLPERAAAW